MSRLGPNVFGRHPAVRRAMQGLAIAGALAVTLARRAPLGAGRRREQAEREEGSDERFHERSSLSHQSGGMGALATASWVDRSTCINRALHVPFLTCIELRVNMERIVSF